ncbi:MAG: electron transfer flavoprotein subunit beta/FixA family protein [Cyclobacteriaceae bacterium]|nr:electron transfer flavoprotein subunit beta/FixA family protein [Cyclobacteriaceae bacterium]
MKILVCITHVPDTTARIAFTDNNTRFDKTGVQYIIGPYDDYALARAVELKEQLGGSITALNVGGSETEPTIRKALAIGADDAVRVDAEPTDSFFVANQIAHVARDGHYDLILMGRESIDYNGGQVHGMVGELLGIPSVSPVMTLIVEGQKVKMTREIEGGKEFVEADMPLVAGCQEPIAEWKIPNMRGIMSARTKPLHVVAPVSDEQRTHVGSYELLPPKAGVKLVDPNDMAGLVNLLKNEAKVI